MSAARFDIAIEPDGIGVDSANRVATAFDATPARPRTLAEALAVVDETGAVPWNWRHTIRVGGLATRVGGRSVLTEKGREAMAVRPASSHPTDLGLVSADTKRPVRATAEHHFGVRVKESKL